MKFSISRRFSLTLAVAFIAIAALPAQANDAGSGYYSWYNAFWGSQQDNDSIASCDVTTLNANVNGFGPPHSTYVPNGGIGIVNISNLLFCQLENALGITSTTGATGVTGSFTFGSTMFFHAVVAGSTGGNARSDGTNTSDTYDYQADIWGCRGNASACAATGSFSKLMQVFWTKDAAGKVNKGKYYMDQSVMNGLSSAYLTAVKWDMGSAAALRYTELKTMCASAYCNPATNWYGYKYFTGTTTHSSFYQTHPGDLSTSDFEARFAASFDTSTNIAESTLSFVPIASPRSASDALKSDAVTFNHCLTRTKTTDRLDWDYGNNGDCSSLGSTTYPNLSINDVDAWTTTDINGNVGFGTMTANPANL